MKIAIIGTGISGLASAYLLNRIHDIEVFEANDYIGGHTNTITVSDAGRPLPIDTGFIVYNTKTYPNLTRLFAELDVPSQWSNMSFSVSSRQTGFEYGSDDLFAQRRNVFNPQLWQIMGDFVRFGRDAKHALAVPHYADYTLGQFAAEKRYSNAFQQYCLIPAASAIWSSPHSVIYDFPAQYFFRFYENHGLLGTNGGVRWRTVTGGSQVYVQKLTAGFRDKIHLNCGATSIRRHENGVTLTLADGSVREFDQVVIATHSDQALRLLADPSSDETDILGKIPYEKNTAILHTDASVLPRSHRAWAAWNYTLHAGEGRDQPASLTYWMNSLQSLETKTNYFVTLNPDASLDPKRIIKTIEYAHPVYSPGSLKARLRLPKINGQRHTHYCGAYATYGFHEDGFNAGLTVAKSLGAEW
jgi:uncharacterized protein